jgi:hypothetical protein
MTESSNPEPTLSKKSVPDTDEVTAYRLGAQLLRELMEDSPQDSEEPPEPASPS